MTKIVVFESQKTSNDKNNDAMSDDEVVASDVTPRYLFVVAFARQRLCALTTYDFIVV